MVYIKIKKARKYMNTLFTTKNLTFVGLLTAVICILAPWSFNIPISPVPISLSTLGIYLAISILGMKLGTLSVLIYILLGLAGVPVFANFTAGAGKLMGPTGGYIIGYLFMALIFGFFVDKFKNHLPMVLFGALAGTAVCYLFGTVWLAIQLKLSFMAALFAGVIPYIPGDLVKLLIAMLLAYPIRKRINKAGLL